MSNSDTELMNHAIAQAEMCKPKNRRNPKVGVVVKTTDGDISYAFRGETEDVHHAEFILLQKKVRSIDLLKGSTLYTTLEPCTTRSHEKKPCVDWIIEKGIAKVFIGILDPNPNICGKGYWRLMDANIQVEFFPYNLAKNIVILNSDFVQLYRSYKLKSVIFQKLVQHNKSPTATQFPGFGFGEALEIQSSPSQKEGWMLSQVEIFQKDKDPFILPKQYKVSYAEYFNEKYSEKRFKDDGEKFMLTINPTSFEEAPTLQLYTCLTKYSIQHFYRDIVANKLAEKTSLIEELVTGSLKARFAHSCSLHMVIVTSDKKLLLTMRSKKVGTLQGKWSCSVEEDLRREDFKENPQNVMAVWSKRTLKEELSLNQDDYNEDNIRVLSVFLETDYLNISFCVYGEININSEALNSHLQVKRGDVEFTNWEFLKLERGVLLKEIFRPSRNYHPSTQYRIIMTFLKYFGEPENSEIEKF